MIKRDIDFEYSEYFYKYNNSIVSCYLFIIGPKKRRFGIATSKSFGDKMIIKTIKESIHLNSLEKEFMINIIKENEKNN